MTLFVVFIIVHGIIMTAPAWLIVMPLVVVPGRTIPTRVTRNVIRIDCDNVAFRITPEHGELMHVCMFLTFLVVFTVLVGGRGKTHDVCRYNWNRIGGCEQPEA